MILDLPLVVRGQSSEKREFQEETFTLALSAHGALLLLATNVVLGQKLKLVNPKTNEEQEGQVVYKGQPYAGMTKVGIDFMRPAPDFWHLTSAPENWKLPQS